jgi:hypothetical protein
MGKSKFRIFAENIKIYQSLKNSINRRIILYNYMTKLLHIFPVGKFSLEFEEDTVFLLFFKGWIFLVDSTLFLD